MPLSADEVVDAALALSNDDRVDVVEAILASLPLDDAAEAILASLPSDSVPPFDEEWRSVIRRRSAELRSGMVKGVLWSEVKRQARERSGG